MIDVADLVKAARARHVVIYGKKSQPITDVLADTVETQAAEIARLRAEQNVEISARLKAEGEFSTLQRRIARQRRALTKLYQRRHDKNAGLVSARREGIKEAAQRLEELHKNHGYNPQTGEVRRRGELVTCPLTIDHTIGYYRALAEGAAHILAAAKEGKP